MLEVLSTVVGTSMVFILFAIPVSLLFDCFVIERKPNG